ncbi:MAG: M23 family metallopeptidase [Pseudomonadota bacterium]
MRTVRFLFFTLLLGATYVLGARFGVPDSVLERLDAAVEGGIERGGELGSIAITELEAEAADLRVRFDRSHTYDDQASAAVSIGGTTVEVAPPPAVVVERPSPVPVQPVTTETNAAAMRLCLTNVSNAPPADGDLNIVGFAREISVDGIALLLAPASNACLSSGYGPRGASGRLHKGVDYFTKTEGNVLAAADGTILEALYRDDYGYMVVIDHGGGVYTRYAHLKRIDEPNHEGAVVRKGDVLGPIGNSGAYTNVVHLHFEILQGDYNTPRKSFGLVPLNPYAALMP